jgi:anti-anti-sigma factor
MLSVTVQKLGDATILHFRGRIVIGDACSILRNAVFGQAHTRMLVLDIAQVDRVDAGGLGVLLDLREWGRSNAIMFKVMNAMNKVEQVLELTRLDRVFEFCSVRDMFCLLRRAATMPWSVDESNPLDAEANGNPSIKGQESFPAIEINGLLFTAD